ncbi:hypothetical protein MPER_08287 [Moniliophthora perniciosa FA553]|nr:hypothetical protein MPER_08287 [Moniliophthora perniciosa FA553]
MSKTKHDGKVLNLPPESEEVAGFYAALIETDHAQDAAFNKNFFEDWLKVLQDHPPCNGIKATDFDKCDFRPMYEYFEAEKAKKKATSAAEKKEIKKQKDEAEAKYTHRFLDGRKEKVGNFRVEPPGLFRGRGEHPKKGSLKYRVCPEDIALNIGKDAPTPIPNIPGKWKAIQHDNTVTWLATRTENINQSHKYVFLAAGSSLKGRSDMAKFEKARELKIHVDRIRQNYTVDLKSKVMAERQRATATCFVDKLALRAGNEKGEDEADTRRALSPPKRYRRRRIRQSYRADRTRAERKAGWMSTTTGPPSTMSKRKQTKAMAAEKAEKRATVTTASQSALSDLLS